MTVPASQTRPVAAAPPGISHADLRLLIDGEWLTTQGRATLPVINPATEEVLGHLPLASPADLDRALEAAQRAWPAWRAMAPVQRGRILRRAAEILRSRTEDIARLATMEQGKTLTETRIEVGMSREHLRVVRRGRSPRLRARAAAAVARRPHDHRA